MPLSLAAVLVLSVNMLGDGIRDLALSAPIGYARTSGGKVYVSVAPTPESKPN